MKRPQSRPSAKPNLPSAPAAPARPIDLSPERKAKAARVKAVKPTRLRASKAAKPPKSQRAPKPAKTPARPFQRRPRQDNVVRLRPRKVALPIAIVVTVIVTTIMLVVNFSPLLAIQEIKVVGTERLHPKSIRNALAGQLGIPLTRVDSNKVAAQLESFSLIESVDVVASPPHTLLVRITERQPIAIVSIGGVLTLVDPVGVQIATAKSTSDYPVIEITGNPRKNANFQAAMDVLLALPSELYPKVASVRALSKDNVTLQLRGLSNQQIVWGDGSQSVLKSKVLAAMFKNTKRSVRLTIDVSSPDAPVVRY